MKKRRYMPQPNKVAKESKEKRFITLTNEVQIDAFLKGRIQFGIKRWLLKAIKDKDKEQILYFQNVLMNELQLCNISHQISILSTCLEDITNGCLKEKYDICSRDGFALKLCFEILDDDFDCQSNNNKGNINKI